MEYTEERVQAFQAVAELRAYGKRMGKIFRNTFGQDSNVVLRHLLWKIFRETLLNYIRIQPMNTLILSFHIISQDIALRSSKNSSISCK